MNEQIILDMQSEIQKYGLWKSIFGAFNLETKTTDGRYFLMKCRKCKSTSNTILFEATGKTCQWSCVSCGASKNKKLWVYLIEHLKPLLDVSQILEVAKSIVIQHVKALEESKQVPAARLHEMGIYKIKGDECVKTAPTKRTIRAKAKKK